jgi:AcrR family transcriptional regulator
MLLMDEKPYDTITISDITKRAGIARQTFYRNYDNKDDVIFEHLTHILDPDLLKIEKEKGRENNIMISFNYIYMVNNQVVLKKILSNTAIENRIFSLTQELPLSLIDQYKDKLTHDEYLICRYKICYQITGCLRAFFDWFNNDMPLPMEKMVSLINAMAIPQKAQYRNIPNVVVRVSKR